jgi:kynurenine formamidase
MRIEVNRRAIAEAHEKLSNWDRWGKTDQIGTLNFVTPERVQAAASLVRKGKVFGMGIPLDGNGPQRGLFGGRWNPIHTMLATGTDAIAERQDETSRMRYADDAINMPVQAATHWDSLGHVFYVDKMYNGYEARQVDSRGVHQLGIEHTRDRMVGRGVLLDVARFKGLESLDDGYAISNDELDAVAQEQRVTIEQGDFVIIRTGQMERCLNKSDWGQYAGGDAPGVQFENCYWCHDKSIAAICSDTWGVEVRPNETLEVAQPWHWVVIPAMGLTMGEMFFVKELAEDCAEDRVYEFLFAGPPLVITGGTGSPINPLAIK